MSITLIDGGLSTELEDMGRGVSVIYIYKFIAYWLKLKRLNWNLYKESKLWTAQWLIDDPDVLKQAHIKLIYL